MSGWYRAGSSRGSPPVTSPGDCIELQVYDDAGNEQGTIIIGIIEEVGKHKEGKVVSAMFLGASDIYYHWWMNEGANAPSKDKGIYHRCMVPAGDCPPHRKYPGMIHGDRYRNLGTSVLTPKKVPWLKDKTIREAYEFCMAKFKGVMAGPHDVKGSVPEPAKKPRAEWAGNTDPSEEGESAKDEESEDERDSSTEDEAMAAKIKKLRSELKKAEEDAAEGKRKRKAMKKKPGAGKSDRAKTRGEKRDPGRSGGEKKKKKDKEKKRKKDGDSDDEKQKKKKKRKERDDDTGSSRGGSRPSKPHKKKRTGEESEDEGSDTSPADEELFGVKPVKSGLKAGEGDRGPFGGGAPVKFPGKEDDSSESESLFQKGLAVTAKSSQQRLLAYTNPYPGRLASRMLLKMEQAVARGTVGPQVNQGQRTPPVALNHILTILLPSLGQKAGLRSTRELKTLGTILDQLASGAPSKAADTVTQRIKAVERATHEGHWGSAQHLELLAPENSMLIEKDEEMYVTKEYLLERKLKMYDRPGPQRDQEGKGKSKGAKGKTKDKDKGDRPNWEKADKGKKTETK
eukprot:s82_g29.t1